MGLTYALLNGASGLRATQTSINTVSHNIANSETAGYSRQRVRIGAQPGSVKDPRRGGRGAQIENINRVYDRFSSEQVRRDRTLLGFFESRERALFTLESIYSEEIAPTINGGFDSFFNSLRDLTRDPANRGARSHFLSGATEIASVFNRVHHDLRSLQIDLDQDISARIEQVNHLTSYIAQLNEQVVVSGDASMDFEDRRDEAIRELSKLVAITVIPEDSGTVNVQLNGIGTLVQDDLAATLQGLPDPNNRRVMTVEFTGIGSNVSRDITGVIDRGELGGLLDLRDQVVEDLIAEVNTMATDFAGAVNAQHTAGYDLNGNRGQDLFVFSDEDGDPAMNLKVNDAITANVDLIAISSQAQRDPISGAITGAVPGDALNGIAIAELQYMTRSAISAVQVGGGYTGTVEVGGSYNGRLYDRILNPLDLNDLDNRPGSSLEQIVLEVSGAGQPDVATFRISFDGGLTFEPAPPGDNPAAPAGNFTIADLNNLFLSKSNVTLQMGNNGSSFNLGDRVEVNLFNKDATFNRKVAETLQGVGQVAADNFQNMDVYGVRLNQSEKLRESIAGVSIDEEMLDLTRFEQQFAANSRVIQTVNELMDSVLELVR
ncbi:MAG: flagellar hook-associated protein FlgK [Myxococcota bacterium]|nr:flagellar hook-associated protein FlgK [Myxococcota bacterium]